MVITTSVNVASLRNDARLCARTVLRHIHHINSDVRRHFLIDCYGIFPCLRHTISYPRTMSAYDVFFCLFFLCLYAGFNYFFLDPILTTFPTLSLVEVGYICRVSMYIHNMPTSQYFVNRDPCTTFVRKSAIIFSVLQYAIYMLLL